MKLNKTWMYGVPEGLFFLYVIVVIAVAAVLSFIIPARFLNDADANSSPSLVIAAIVGGLGFLLAYITGFYRWSRKWTRIHDASLTERRILRVKRSGMSSTRKQRKLEALVKRIQRSRHRFRMPGHSLDQEFEIFQYAQSNGLKIAQFEECRSCPKCSCAMRAMPNALAVCLACKQVWIHSKTGAECVRRLSHEATHNATETEDTKCIECSRQLKTVEDGQVKFEFCANCECVLVDLDQLNQVLTYEDDWSTFLMLMGQAINTITRSN